MSSFLNPFMILYVRKYPNVFIGLVIWSKTICCVMPIASAFHTFESEKTHMATHRRAISSYEWASRYSLLNLILKHAQ